MLHYTNYGLSYIAAEFSATVLLFIGKTSDRLLTGYNQTMIGFEKSSFTTLLKICVNQWKSQMNLNSVISPVKYKQAKTD